MQFIVSAYVQCVVIAFSRLLQTLVVQRSVTRCAPGRRSNYIFRPLSTVLLLIYNRYFVC